MDEKCSGPGRATKEVMCGNRPATAPFSRLQTKIRSTASFRGSMAGPTAPALLPCAASRGCRQFFRAEPIREAVDGRPAQKTRNDKRRQRIVEWGPAHDSTDPITFSSLKPIQVKGAHAKAHDGGPFVGHEGGAGSWSSANGTWCPVLFGPSVIQQTMKAVNL